jgi:DEAD/DEAH box helicase domain-containing protein
MTPASTAPARDVVEQLDDGQVACATSLPPRARRAGVMPAHLHPDVQDVLEREAITTPHAFQQEAIELLIAGEDTVLAGGTGSGKSLCYMVPVLHRLREQRSATALYISPTKALAQDQARRLRDLAASWASPMILDGDTPAPARSVVRRSGRLVLTNPDMLHASVLPRHAEWARFLRGLAYIVIDESHVYRGVFGSHVGQVIRRLVRLCEHYGSQPVIVASSGTIGNPAEHVCALTGRADVTVVGDHGAPRAERDIVLWNPSWDEAAERRDSALADAARIYVDLIRAGIPTIVFARSRRSCELIHSFAADRLRSGDDTDLVQRIAPYRAGYTPEERRSTERDLASGRLLGVVATNALELGIDIGSLDAAICVTWPGSMTSMWQQWGRAGRWQRGLSVLIAGDDALDQYFMREPEQLLARPIEHAVISTTNPRIIDPHLAAAAAELPLSESTTTCYDPETLESARARLVAQGVLIERDGRAVYARGDTPSRGVSLRSAAGGRVSIIESATGLLLGDVEDSRVARTLHPGAIYLHRGVQYEVDVLDLDARVALLTTSTAPWYTLPKLDTDMHVLETTTIRQVGEVLAHWGIVEVHEQLVGYQRTHVTTQQVLDIVPRELPPFSYSTEAIWFAPPPESLADMDEEQLLGSLHAAEHALIAMLPLIATCDRADIGGLSTNWHEALEGPAIFIYDGHPGGVGITKAGFDTAEQWIHVTCSMLAGCRCDTGCPSCVQSPKCGNLNEPLDKAGALKVLRSITQWEPGN